MKEALTQQNQALQHNVTSNLRSMRQKIAGLREDTLDKVEIMLGQALSQRPDNFEDSLTMILDDDDMEEKHDYVLQISDLSEKALREQTQKALQMEEALNLLKRRSLLTCEKGSYSCRMESETAMLKFQQAEEMIKELQTRASSVETKIKNEQQKFSISEERYQHLEEDLERVNEKLKESEDKRSLLHQELSLLHKTAKKTKLELTSEIERLQESCATTHREESRFKEELKRVKTQIAGASNEKQNLIVQLAALHEAHSQCSKADVEREKYLDLQEEVESLRLTLAHMEDQLQQTVGLGLPPDDRKTLLSEVEDRRLLAESEKVMLEKKNKDLARQSLRLRSDNDRLKADIFLLQKELLLFKSETSRNLAEQASQMSNMMLLGRNTTVVNVTHADNDSDDADEHISSLNFKIKALQGEVDRLMKENGTLRLLSQSETSKSTQAELERAKASQEVFELQAQIHMSKYMASKHTADVAELGLQDVSVEDSGDEIGNSSKLIENKENEPIVSFENHENRPPAATSQNELSDENKPFRKRPPMPLGRGKPKRIKASGNAKTTKDANNNSPLSHT
ncbi:hypothetical protein BC829DRAFT_379607 [Chytridium lagenaria]|nr:hypothetical protein BC829DRAFT_379607 [Chytridium lagenaria]